MKMNISITGAVLCLLAFNSINAQDVHLSQFQYGRLLLNPALTGLFNGDRQATVVNKEQYFSVPVDYVTVSGSYDMNFRQCYSEKSFFSAGALFNYDQSGDAKLSLASLTANGSYTIALGNGFFIGGGVYVGLGQRSFNTKDLTWDNQWSGTGFDPTIPSGESFKQTSFTFVDVGSGANFRIQGKDRTKLDVGLGAFHLNRPTYSFYDDSDFRLPIRLSLYGLGVVKLGESIDLFGNVLRQDQGPYSETVLGGGVIIHLSNRKARELEVHLGFLGRLEDAMIPQIAIRYDGWLGGFSYDLNTSPFKEATDQKGGPEFFLTYTFKKLCPLKQTKVCTIF
jgi:type IX secretion system PorP/SprF family membrane protein